MFSPRHAFDVFSTKKLRESKYSILAFVCQQYSQTQKPEIISFILTRLSTNLLQWFNVIIRS